MKKLLAVAGLFGLLFGISNVSHAGVALDQGYSPASYNKGIVVSTFTLGANSATLTIAPPTVSGVSCVNCFTRFFAQLAPTTTMYILDGATTDYFIEGNGLGTGSVNPISLPEDHLGPVCFSAGKTTTISISNTATASNVANIEGYSNCGVSRNANQ